MTKSTKTLIHFWRKLAPPLIIRRKIFGLSVFFNIRDHLFYLFQSHSDLESFEPSLVLLKSINGMFWDVGCNAGLFSLRAAQLGMSVVSFDIAPAAISLLKKSAAANGLNITTVPQGFSVTVHSYNPPTSAHPENSIKSATINNQPLCQSMTYIEAANQFGIPTMIKMDIEGAEADFLHSKDFHRWLSDNRIMWLVEIHRPLHIDEIKINIQHVKIDSVHILFNPQPDMDLGLIKNGIM